jgi:hypothetical protein
MLQDYSFLILRILIHHGAFPSSYILGFSSVIPSKTWTVSLEIQDTFLHFILINVSL